MIIKRNKSKEEFSTEKIEKALLSAFISCGYPNNKYTKRRCRKFAKSILPQQVETVEDVQDKIEDLLMSEHFYDVAKAYIIYRKKHEESRLIRSRLNYMEQYSTSSSNASSSSETDANANVSMKNVANLEGEVYKATNRIIQRQRMKDKLYELYPEVAKKYEEDLNNHIIYTHDEASTPVLKPYCMAVTLYPLMIDGVGKIDGITPSAPNDISSFSGQVTNLAFLLSSQCKGAVAFGDYFVTLNYYVVKEFGDNWYEKLDCISTSEHHVIPRTIKDSIEKGMKQFIWGVNQPAGNRSYNSPFTNVSWYDKYYFESLFGNFHYPDRSKPKWEQVDTLQRMFMALMRRIRLIKPITFPVTTMALVHNNKEYLDKDYKELCAEEWAKGGSFFCYTSDNPSSLASCCRVLNEMSNNTFSSTTGMTGVMTGSCNVITLNINRIVQDWAKEETTWWSEEGDKNLLHCKDNIPLLKKYLVNILERVYKYHIAYKTMLYDLEERGMLAPSNGDYIYIKKLYSTIGIIGYTEAAKFLGLEISNNKDYKEFLQLILGTIKEQNKLHSIKDKKRPFLFNSEAVPGEGLGIKLYNWDKEDGYEVPEDQNLYNCYFYNPWSTNTSVLDKIKLHGKDVAYYTDGGQACHINLDTHLSKEQYIKLLDVAKNEGCNYFTFNIPISECKDCNYIVNAPIKECPKCGSHNIKYYTRIIGYLTAVDNWSIERQEEFKHRKYYH
ncbi:MAG: anaerobic ribonucleoside-triphosphate reductase [Clostridium sp.]|nr:anaerobic ribonucleoside-triphosphate reductase [Clostridium sp.]